MEHIRMKLTEEHVRWAALGGSILGGGGGGSAKTGAEFGDLAVRFSHRQEWSHQEPPNGHVLPSISFQYVP